MQISCVNSDILVVYKEPRFKWSFYAHVSFLAGMMLCHVMPMVPNMWCEWHWYKGGRKWEEDGARVGGKEIAD